MKLVGIRKLKIGEKLSTPIRMADGRILLPKGAQLTERYIERLKNIGIFSVYVEDEFFDDINVISAIEDNTKSEAIKILRTIYSFAEKDKLFDEYEVKGIVKKIIEDVRAVIGSPINIINTYTIDDPRYLHAINVCVISIAIGITKGLAIDMLEDIAVGAFLHDIKLPVMEADKREEHTQEGFEYLKSHRGLSTRSNMIAYAHHENCDGTGFPRKVKKEGIYEGARLVAVADLYDRLLYGYMGMDAMTPYQAYEYMNMQSEKILDMDMIEAFKNCVALYPTGAIVELSNGKKGVVSKQNSQMPFRPVVRVHENNTVEEYNLLDKLTVFIEKIDI